MKKIMMMAVAFVMSAGAFAQTEIVVGDMNDDGNLSVGDVSDLTETILGKKPVRTIRIGGNPAVTDNSSLVGSWAYDGGYLSFGADGKTNYCENGTYKYKPQMNVVIFFDANGAAVDFAEVLDLGDNLVLNFRDGSLKTYNTTNASIGGVTYKDLALPDNTLWAACNVGATAPEEIGNYYAWGETTSKDSYTEANYKFYSFEDDVLTVTAYNNKDKNTLLYGRDDAAYTTMGTNWLMPTKDQVETLLANTTGEWTTVNGVEGRLLTSKINGNTIFFPATGKYNGEEITETYAGYYWTSTLTNLGETYAYTLSLSAGAAARNTSKRHIGYPIRPVMKK